MAKETFESFDNIDAIILRALAENPRIPYSKITDILAEKGHEMSPEGVRYRVDKIIDLTTVFFLVDPQQVSWEILRVAVSTENTEGSKREAFEFLCEQAFWHVSRGIGTYDLYAVGSLPSLREVDELVTKIDEADCVNKVEYIVVTGRNQNMTQYLNIDYLTAISEE